MPVVKSYIVFGLITLELGAGSNRIGVVHKELQEQLVSYRQPAAGLHKLDKHGRFSVALYGSAGDAYGVDKSHDALGRAIHKPFREGGDTVDKVDRLGRSAGLRPG